MKDIIDVKIDKEHNFISNVSVIGRKGENNSAQLNILLDDVVEDCWVYLDFSKPDKTTFKTPKLNIVDQSVSYEIPSSLLDFRGELEVQAVLQNEKSVIWKSAIKTFYVEESIDATEDIPDKDDFIKEAQSILDGIEDALTPTIGENGNWYLGNRDTGKPSKGVDGKDGYTPQKNIDYFDGKDGKNGLDGNDYVITDKDYQAIGAVVETNIQPTLEDNLKESKDYVNNAIIKDIKNVSYNQNTGTFTFTRHDNTTLTIDLPIEQTVKNGRYDEASNELVLILVSGQEIKIPVTGLIEDYNGVSTATIQCVVSSDNKISCNIISGSVSKTLLTADLQNEISGKVNKTSFVYDAETETLSISI